MFIYVGPLLLINFINKKNRTFSVLLKLLFRYQSPAVCFHSVWRQWKSTLMSNILKSPLLEDLVHCQLLLTNKCWSICSFDKIVVCVLLNRDYVKTLLNVFLDQTTEVLFLLFLWFVLYCPGVHLLRTTKWVLGGYLEIRYCSIRI